MRGGLEFEHSISRWDEGLPLGNGLMGCLIWGGPRELRFSLDRTDIWDLTPPAGTEQEDFTYENMVRLTREKRTEEIRRIFDAPYQRPVPTKLPAGKLILEFGEGNVSSVLDFETAQAVLTVRGDFGKQIIRAICHGVEGTGMIQVENGLADPTVRLVNPPFGGEKDGMPVSYDAQERRISQGALSALCYPAAVSGEKNCEEGTRLFWFTQEITREFSYGVVAGVRKGAKDTLIFYRILTSPDGENWLEDGTRKVREQLAQGYEAHFETHRKWWRDYWGQSCLSLPDPFFEKQWYLTNYLFASCSRKGGFPMPLQGVWTADDGMLPPWKGDYHNDLNTQLSYTHFYKSNHLAEGECFLDFLWNLRDAGRDFAKKFYHTEGICLPGVMTIDGRPLGGWPMYSLSPTQQIWLCQSFELYYRYTGDREFLEKKAWVFFEETARCLGGLLEAGADGLYRLPVSSSPEIHDDEAAAWVTPNSNYDLALVRYLYGTLADFSHILGNGQAGKWNAFLGQLPEFSVNERHVLMISPDECLKESHRHLSNAMAICPLGLYRYETPEDREVIDGVVEDYERLGTGGWTGFSFAWMAHLYAIQRNGQGAREQLRILWDSFCGPNGFHLNGDFKKRGYSAFHYRPFTLEANMYGADGLQEMLLQTAPGRVDLFPAIPEDWKEMGVEFENFRAHGGILVSAAVKGGRLRYLSLQSAYDQRMLVRTWEDEKMESMDISLKAGKCFLWGKKE